MTQTLVVFAEDWGRHPSATQHLVRRLAATSPVLWINSIGMRRPRLTMRDARRAAGKLFSQACTTGNARAALDGILKDINDLKLLS